MPRILPVNEDERIAICSVPVTLDGRPATINGTHNELATISDEHGNSINITWTTTAYIAARGRKFHTKKNLS